MPLQFHYSRFFSCLPLIIMIGPAVALSLYGVISTSTMIAFGVVGLMVGSFFAKQKAIYWGAVNRALADPTGLLIFALFLLVGIYAELLVKTNLAEGLLWISQAANVTPTVYAVFIYIICSLLGIAMGTSVGIVIIMTPVIYPAAVAAGVSPALAAGAILAGAATGDHLAPLSDTTIISSSTQHYRDGKSVSVGRVVRDRLAYVIPAMLISVVLYLMAGFWMDAPTALHELSTNGAAGNPLTLVMLVPMATVVITAVYGRSIFEALTYGMLFGFIVALGFELIQPSDLLSIEDSAVKGIVVEGAMANIDTIVMIILMMGAYGVMRESGLLDRLASILQKNVSKTPTQTELTMFGIGWFLSFLLVGLVARVTVVAGPIFDALGKTQDLHPSRRANILDGIANSFSFVVPWHVWPLFMIISIKPLQDLHPGLPVPAPTDFIMTTFYPLVIWLVMLLSILTGYRRKFEKPD